MERIILHIDVNSAFLSWSSIKLLEEGYKYDLRRKVAVIAGDPSKRHGVIVAASVPAKKKGIKPPINLYEARKIYRDLIVVKPDYEYYKKCSLKMINFLKKVFQVVEQYSIDECFVDYTGMQSVYGNEISFAYKLKDEIYKRYGFTVNVGIGNSKLCAKMASDFEKPNKVHTLYDYEFRDKIWNKDISDLFMVGKASCKKLRELGINTIGELANFDKNVLISKFKSYGKMIYDYANGIDNSPLCVNSYNERKSIGYSRTLDASVDDKTIIFGYLKKFSFDISNYLNKKKIYARTLVVTIRNDKFKTINHQEKYLNNIYLEDDIFEKSKVLFNKIWDGENVRLIGLSATDFSDSNDYQLSLFDNPKIIQDKNDTDDLLKKLNKEFGDNIVFRANNLK